MEYDSMVGGDAIGMGIGAGVDLADMQRQFAEEEAEHDADEADPVLWLKASFDVTTIKRDMLRLAERLATAEQVLSDLSAKLPLQHFAGRTYTTLPGDVGVLFSDGEQMSWKALNDWIMSVLKSQSALPATPASTPAPTKQPAAAPVQATRKGRKPSRYTGTLDELKAEVASGDWRHARIDWATADVQAFLRGVKDIPKRLAFIHAAISSEDRVAFCTPERLEAWKKELHFDSCFKSA